MAVDRDRVAAAVRDILAAIGEDPDRPGLKATPQRVADAYAEFFAGVGEDAAAPLAHTISVSRGPAPDTLPSGASLRVPLGRARLCLHDVRGVLAAIDGAEVDRLVLTASGGPFRGMTREQLAHVNPEQALRHLAGRLLHTPSIRSHEYAAAGRADDVVAAMRVLYGIEPEHAAPAADADQATTA